MAQENDTIRVSWVSCCLTQQRKASAPYSYTKQQPTSFQKFEGKTVMAIIMGTPDNDKLKGSLENDTITGEAGNDTLIGVRGNDSLSGGEGADRLIGNAGDDTLLGDPFL